MRLLSLFLLLFCPAVSMAWIMTLPSSPRCELFRPAARSLSHSANLGCGRTTFVNHRRSTSAIQMGWLDGVSDYFLQKREGDFVKLDEVIDTYGPGPLVVLCNVPNSIENEEIKDMIQDGAPNVKQCTLYRVSLADSSADDKALDLEMQDALQQIADGRLRQGGGTPASSVARASAVPVLLFSGFSNADMLAAYNIIGQEIYAETAGRSQAACAKAVPNAMQKPLRQVLEEIAGDHEEALAGPDKKEQE